MSNQNYDKVSINKNDSEYFFQLRESLLTEINLVRVDPSSIIPYLNNLKENNIVTNTNENGKVEVRKIIHFYFSTLKSFRHLLK